MPHPIQPETSRAAVDAAGLELIPDREVRRMLGGISEMTLWRLDRDPAFPKPIRLGGKRKYRRLAELRAFLDAKAQESIHSRDRPGQSRRAA